MKYIATLIVFLVLVVGIYLALAKPTGLQPTVGIVCTEEAMQCPDGSYVGRTGPNCEFAACPTPVQTDSGIQGVVLLGPTCPVLRDPPDPQCADKVFQTSLALRNADGTKVIQIFKSDVNGKFTLQVKPGTYTISSSPSTSMLPRCSSNGAITVKASSVASTTIYCDTGIR